MRIVQFSDVHVMENFSPALVVKYGWRRGVGLVNLKLSGRARDFGDSGATFRNLMTKVRTLSPDHVIFSGDFTATATTFEFRQSIEIIGDFFSDPRKFSVVPGNHDRYTKGSIQTRRFEHFFGALLKSDLPEIQTASGFPFVRILGDFLAVVGVDTTRLAPFPGLSFGQIPLEDLTALGRILEHPEIYRRRVMLLMHHAPFGPSGKRDTIIHGLRHLNLFLDVVHRHPRLTIHCGHIHRRYVLNATERHPPIFNSGSGTLHQNPGFLVFHIDDDGNIDTVREEVVSIG